MTPVWFQEKLIKFNFRNLLLVQCFQNKKNFFQDQYFFYFPPITFNCEFILFFRVDNLSAVPVTVLQEGCRDASVRCEIPSESSLPYVFDEPALDEILICQVRNSKPVSVALTDLQSTATLHYENLLYIVSRNLVLDVDGSKKLFVTKKESSRRSQLWRIDSRGTLGYQYPPNTT